MLKSSIARLLVAALGVGLPAAAHASLIGDAVDIVHAFPNKATVLASETVIVAAGTPEIACTGNKTGPHEMCTFSGPPGSNNAAWNIDIEETSIALSWPEQDPSSFWNSGGDFNGLVFSDFDWSDTDREITGLVTTSNFPNWSDSRATFTADSLTINFPGGDTLDSSSFLNVEILTQPIPEPSTGLLVVSCLTALAIARRNSRDRGVTASPPARPGA